MTNVFISHPSPHNKQQKQFLALIDVILARHKLNPVNLGRSNWSYKSPMKPILEMMNSCKAAVIIGLERHHHFIGYEKEDSKSEKEFIHRYTSTPWIQIESGIAYALGLPLLILKERKLSAEGILDSNSSDYYIFEFDLREQSKKLSNELEQFMFSWIKEFTEVS